MTAHLTQKCLRPLRCLSQSLVCHKLVPGKARWIKPEKWCQSPGQNIKSSAPGTFLVTDCGLMEIPILYTQIEDFDGVRGQFIGKRNRENTALRCVRVQDLTESPAKS